MDGGCLPDGPFYNPKMGTTSTPALDIFGLGSLSYTIMTGYWPYRPSPAPFTVDEKVRYEAMVQSMILRGNFPDVSCLVGGIIISGYWKMEFKSAEEVLRAIREMT